MPLRDREIIPQAVPSTVEGLNTRTKVSSPTNIVEVLPGSIFNDGKTKKLEVSTVLEMDITNTGANGRDTGPIGTDQWWYIWIIEQDSNGAIKTLASLSNTTPTLPTGHTSKALIGAVWVDSAGNFSPFETEGEGPDKVYRYLTQRYIIVSGTATTRTAVSLTNFVPNMSSGYGHFSGRFDYVNNQLLIYDSSSLTARAGINWQSVGHNSALISDIGLNDAGEFGYSGGGASANVFATIERFRLGI